MSDGAVSRSCELLDSGWNCAEAVLQAIAENQGIDCRLIPKIATGFGGGLAHTAGTCGALSGAVLGIGLALGRDASGEASAPCYDAVHTFRDTFVARFGSDNCLELTGCHLGTPEGRARFVAENLHTRCLELVAVATSLALEAIAQP
jgi:C_GCAxxG_C_C family probable redox protein